MENVKRRRYESQRRREQAEQTRRDVIEAAGKLFREHGYAVSMPAIAREASVAVETVYRIFGTKAALFRAVIEALLAGGTARARMPVEERPAIRALIEEPDPYRQIELYAATQPGIHRRAGPLLRALYAASRTEPDLSRLWQEMEAWRLEGQGRFVGLLAERGALRPELSFEVARDIVWTLSSLAVHDLLVGDRGWTYERYQEWLAQALTRELLPS